MTSATFMVLALVALTFGPTIALGILWFIAWSVEAGEAMEDRLRAAWQARFR